MLTLTDGAIVDRSVSSKERKAGVILIVADHAGKSGKADGRTFLCTLHPTAGGADDGTFREGGIAWHATDGGCNVAADALALPEESRKAASKTRRSPEEQRAAMVERARAKALNR